MTPLDMIERALRKISDRSTVVVNRRAWYEGNHPVSFGSEPWFATYAERVKGAVDNQCRIAVNTRASVLIPKTFTPRAAGVVADANATWVTERIVEVSTQLLETVRTAKWSGVETAVFVDYNADGDVALYPLSPESAHVEVDRGGAILWAFFIWRDADDFIQGTLVTQSDRYWFSTAAKVGWPTAGEYKPVEQTPNPLGEVPVAVFDDGGSIIDEIWPINALLNTSIQTRYVVEEKAATPTRIWWGLQVFNQRTGKVEGPTPDVNPATGAADITIPTLTDQNGDGGRRVDQLETRSPQDWNGIHDEHRKSIARLASVPASALQAGADKASAEALEIEYRPFVTAGDEDRARYTGAMNRLARIMVSLRMLKLTGRPSTDAFSVKWAPIDTSTTTSRVNNFVSLVSAGVTIYDAAIDALGASPEHARKLQDNHNAQDSEALAKAGAQFLAGV